MNITIDTSVILAVLTNEPGKQALIQFVDGMELIAPQSVHWEIGNALSAMFKRGRISLEQAISCLKNYQLIPLRYVDVSLERAIGIAHRHRIYAYDAYLIACAQQFGNSLLTLDSSLRQTAAREGVITPEIAP